MALLAQGLQDLLCLTVLQDLMCIGSLLMLPCSCMEFIAMHSKVVWRDKALASLYSICLASGTFVSSG